MLALVAAFSVSQVRADYEERRSFESEKLTINNLIGEITVTGHSGSAFEVLIRIQGRDASDAAGLEILSNDGARGQLTVKFPNADRFVYPRLGSGSRTTFSPNRGEDGWLGEIFGGLFGKKIKVSGSGSGLEIWADVEVKVPRGGSLRVRHGVGQIEADEVSGNLALEIRSGHVRATRVEGDLLADTGSGHVEVADIVGRLNVDTGSGHVEAARVRGPEMQIDTGSGHVTIDGADSPRLVVDTGSGHVEASGLSTDSAHIDTGSGRVRLQLDRMGGGEYLVDTGSGRIVLQIPRDASLDVRAETGSGDIDLDLEGGVELRRKQRDEVEFRIGGGDARVRLDTGSGGIRIVYND
jgi:hypothetical protein